MILSLLPSSPQLHKDLCDIRMLQVLLGQQDVRATRIYLHALNRGGRGVDSPAGRL